MRGKTASLLFVCLSSWVLTVASPKSTSDDLAPALNKQVSNYDLSATNFVDGLTRVGSEFKIPLGIAWMSTPSARTEVRLHWKRAKVREIIEAIVHTQPGYQARVDNGVVQISSPGLLPDSENFLTLRNEAFAVHSDHIEAATLKLHNFVNPARLRARFSYGIDLNDPVITLELRKPTVEEVLDAVAATSTRKIWIVTFADNPALAPRGYRKTLSLWSAVPLSDEGQPAWDLLHWGDRIPWAVAPGQ